MSIFNNDIIESPLTIGNCYDIQIKAEGFMFQSTTDVLCRSCWKYIYGNDDRGTIRKHLIEMIGKLSVNIFSDFFVPRTIQTYNVLTYRPIRKVLKKIFKREILLSLADCELNTFPSQAFQLKIMFDAFQSINITFYPK